MPPQRTSARSHDFMARPPSHFKRMVIYPEADLEGKPFMASYADSPRYQGNQQHDHPLGPLTSLNKRVNLVNPFRDFVQLVHDMSVPLLQSGKPFRDRFHDAYSKLPPPWL